MNPLVIQPVEQVGEYGGTMRFGSVETNLWNLSCLRCSGLVKYNQENTEGSVDIAKSILNSTSNPNIIVSASARLVTVESICEED